jgi:hypothetical protein
LLLWLGRLTSGIVCQGECGGGDAALAGGLKQDDGTGHRHIERRNGAGHGDAEQVVAVAADEIVKAGTFATEDQGAGCGVVELVVGGGAALVETEDPDAGGLDLLQGAGHVDDAGHTDVLGGAGGGLGGDAAERGCPALGRNDAVDACAVGGTEERAEVLRIFDAIEGEKQGRFTGNGLEELFELGEGLGADDGDDTLVAGGFGEVGEVLARLEADADAALAAEGGDAVDLGVDAIAGEADMVEGAGAGAHGFFDRVQSVENFHPYECSGRAGRNEAVGGTNSILRSLWRTGRFIHRIFLPM